MHFFVVSFFHYIFHRGCFILIYIFLNNFNYPCSFRSSHNNANSFKGFNLFGRNLAITPRYKNNGLGVKIMCTAYHLAGFSFALTRYGAGVYYINIAHIVKGSNFIAPIFKQRGHCFCFILIDFATECAK